ncbi:conjugal transfer protein TrbD [Campylobacter coli]|uniref:Conjugal transfer protein TrbD n=3 Tax=Campylobacterales TaxID=213849 RepID=A0A5T1VKR8_CAMJU|nr:MULTISPECIES: conjugal transfer protein TrbD [Campylobacterales]EAH6956214.1 conjugal transfer protein TrbD [Campylobacter jejuni]EAK3888401.1 conjugal transfer protein TrbD [Campylobacter hyointestinalis]EBY0525872.1 conjugal transfer protein TrbD [Salmonella enterica subsp. enterica serovar Typhimurium]APA55134.1 conjugal transfer protein TrbD [Campylobacter coli]EAC1287444.1 conjugal transfer protein TrbD [Campylobacter coli]
MEELQKIDIYSALNKPNLIFGADRELMLITGLISFALIFTGATLITSVIGIALFFVCGLLLRLMAKSDPLMRQIFIRQNKYKKFYYPQSTPFSKD